MVSVETIPVAYAHLLDPKKLPKILAEVQIFGTTLGDVDVDFKPFVYPIKLCDGCRTICGQGLGTMDPPITKDDIYGDACPDNAGYDDRVCIDPNC